MPVASISSLPDSVNSVIDFESDQLPKSHTSLPIQVNKSQEDVVSMETSTSTGLGGEKIKRVGSH